MNTTTTITFEVSDVQRATTPLSEVPYGQAVAGQLNTSSREQMLSLYGWKNFVAANRRNRIAGVESKPAPAITAVFWAASTTIRSWPPCTWHSWTTVPFAFHQHDLADDLPGGSEPRQCPRRAVASRFVQHRGKLSLEVERNDRVKGSLKNPWPKVFTEFSTRIQEHIETTIHLFLPTFSTTGPAERSAC